MRQNLQCVGQGKLRRGVGWDKFLNRTSDYNNEDFHDQLLAFDSNSIRQPLTLLFEAESTQKVRSLWAAKQGAVFKLNGYSGNWKMIGSGYGGDLVTSAAAPRFKAAQLGDYLIFTNDYDKPMYHILEQPPSLDVMVTENFVEPAGGGTVAVNFNYPEAIPITTAFTINGITYDTFGPGVNPVTLNRFSVGAGGATVPAGTFVYDGGGHIMPKVIPGLQTFPDLDLINLTRAAVVWVWKNCLFFADVTMDNQRYGYRLLWSDYLNPLGFDPAQADSITGSFDLQTHERILGGAPSVNGFLIYTTHGIWEMTAVGGEESFAFRRCYNGEDNKGKGLLKYPNTLSNTISHGHIYMAEDGIYSFSQFMSAPERVEWMDRAGKWLYGPDDSGYVIDSTNCQVHIAGQLGDEILIFSADEGVANNCPNRGIRLNLKYEVADVIDHGFTALCNHRPAAVPTIRDFILENQICDLAGLRALGYDYVSEGLPRVFPPTTAAFVPDRFYSDVDQSLDPAITVEDWNQANPSEHSLCALLGDRKLDDQCPKCEGPSLLVMADSVDWCLKQMAGATVFYRENCANPTATGDVGTDGYTSSVGSYILAGYDSILRLAQVFVDGAWVEANQFQLDYVAEVQATPTNIGLRIGISGQPADANFDTARIVWFQHSLQPLRILTARTPAQHLTANTIPAENLTWRFFRKGPILHFELKIAGTGGNALLSKVIGSVGRIEIGNKWG